MLLPLPAPSPSASWWGMHCDPHFLDVGLGSQRPGPLSWGLVELGPESTFCLGGCRERPVTSRFKSVSTAHCRLKQGPGMTSVLCRRAHGLARIGHPFSKLCELGGDHYITRRTTGTVTVPPAIACVISKRLLSRCSVGAQRAVNGKQDVRLRHCLHV